MKATTSVFLLTCLAGNFIVPSSLQVQRRSTRDEHSAQVDVEGKTPSKEFPCPVGTEIVPCFCTYDTEKQTLTLDCSEAQTEAELEAVFSATFPVTTFTELIIQNNDGLIVLGDVFETVTFEIVTLVDVHLEAITETSLIGSVDTLREFYIRGSRLSLETIHFLTFGLYPNLYKVYVGVTPKIDSFPILRSDYLTYLDLPSNNMGSIPLDAFDEIPNISVFSAYNESISELLPGTFDGYMASLRHINMGSNSLTRLLPGSLHVTNLTTFIGFQDNTIAEVAVGAFVVETNEGTNTTASVTFINNQLTTLDSTTWRDLVLVVRDRDLRGNPLTCGCDLAWLVLAPDLMAKVHPDSTWYDSRVLHELDPADYTDFC